MEYNFREVETKWQKYWREHQTYKTEINTGKPKCFVLDMFPYPSGAGLHVGHPLGYIASDIYARYKRLKGFNVLHPMGYDSFGLPAEQYAIQTGQHPAVTTENNIARYREQLDKIAFSFDWSREVRTSDPSYYKWTQWIFIQFFQSWYDTKLNKAKSIDALISTFEREGNYHVTAVTDQVELFSDAEWKSFDEEKQQYILLNYRLAYLADMWVNWCPALGTVLANEEVKDGVSERGGYPVERKQMKQWCLRITAYAERLLNDLNTIDWPESIKEAQRNWIGKSEGALVSFRIQNSEFRIDVFTTRPDTIFGVSFLTIAPEHELVDIITTAEQKKAVDDYVTYAKNRSERERMSEVKKITGVFTGAYAIHPFTGAEIPVWIGDYVLAGYGTGAVMAVPAGDQRDWDFAKYFDLPIPAINKDVDISAAADPTKDAVMINSDFLNGMTGHDAIKAAIKEIENRDFGKGKINYRMRDAIFGRQRYWGEPIPVYYKNNIPYTLSEDELPLVLPEVDKYLPTEDGEPPLARAKDWKYKGEYIYEHSTMPGWAGSSWYYLRYMDPENKEEFASEDALDYWQDVDLYIGGAEHATGHLLYVRFWTKFLFDLGYISVQEPAKKLINQGMIQGVSYFLVGKFFGTLTNEKGKTFDKEIFKWCSVDRNEIIDSNGKVINHIEWKNKERININYVDTLNNRLYKHRFELLKKNSLVIATNIRDEDIVWERDSLTGFDFVNLATEVEKMSKSKLNVVSPDSFEDETGQTQPGIIDQYGADCLRLYEMFLGPLEQSKPWNTNGISGVSNFLRKLWRLYHNKEYIFTVSEEAPSAAELKSLHKTIRKAEEDIERFSFNTSVSTFMICVNELTDLKCNKRAVLEPLAIVLSSYAPHITEELWKLLGHEESITKASFPQWKEEFLVEDNYEYPVSVNGKTRFKLNIPRTLTKEEIEKRVMASEEMTKYLNGDQPKKVIVVPGRIVNIVV
jgi:leucyl-tRNA synthetase